jgi:hypothetical protein
MSVREPQRSTTTTAALHACASVYPLKQPSTILRDLAAHAPGEEGKWFAAAKDARLYELALDFARRSQWFVRTNAQADQATRGPGRTRWNRASNPRHA